MKGMRGVDPQKTYSNPDVPEVPDIPRPRKTFTMTNVPKRYNPEKDAIETVPLGKFYEDRSHRNGVMIVSPGAPKWKVGYTFENFVVGESNKFAYTTATRFRNILRSSTIRFSYTVTRDSARRIFSMR